MCAIAGIYSSLHSLPVLKGILDSMKMRGEDAQYVLSDGNFHAGMNRLSINDLEHGSQPFKNHDGSIWVFLNGEIYNHQSLRGRLKNQVVLQTHCDGAVLPFLYEEYGIECLDLLDGMFGIAIYDQRHHKIFLARDYMGEKPLYFTYDDQQFSFCTLISPLKQITATSLNPLAIWDFFTFGFIPEPQTIFKEIEAVPKGCYLEFDMQRQTYQMQSFVQESFFCPSGNVVESVKEAVCLSVSHRLLSDVGVGAFLSGGLDSSIVAALIKQEREDLSTFNIAFKQGRDPYHDFADESMFAREVARHLHTDHHEIVVDSKSFRDYLPLFIESIDQPFGAISGIGVKMIARMAKQMGIKVLCSGDGADEFFGGYPWYPKLCLNDPLAITQEKPKGWHYYAFESEKKSFLSQEFFEGCDSRRYFPSNHLKPLDFILFDREFYLPFEMMTKLDRMCMSEGVEGRACFVSPQIIQCVQHIDYELLLQKGEKWLLKEAFRDLLPESVVNRSKHGFNVPIDDWMKQDWIDLLENALSENSHLRRAGILHERSRLLVLDLLFSTDRRVGNIAFFLIVLEMWLALHA